MKKTLLSIFLTLTLVSTLFLPNTFAQDYTQMNLPEGAIARFGKGRITQIKYSPDGTQLAVAGGIGVWLYETSTYQEIDLFTGHTESVRTVAFSPDGKTIATGSWDGTIRLWDSTTDTYKKRLIARNLSTDAITFSPDGKKLASGSLDGTVLLWELAPSTSKN